MAVVPNPLVFRGMDRTAQNNEEKERKKADNRETFSHTEPIWSPFYQNQQNQSSTFLLAYGLFAASSRLHKR
jgi:hypothetical protein